MATLAKSEATQLRQAAKTLSEKTTRTVLELADILYQTFYDTVKVGGKDVATWELWGHSSWSEYVEHELGIHQTTAQNFRKIHEVFNIDLAGSWDKSQTQSYTKMRILCRVVTKANVKNWLKRAEDMSCCELDDAVMHYLHGRKRMGRMHTLAVLVTKKELQKINDILELARHDFGEDDRRGETLIRVLEEWRNIHKRVSKLKTKAA